MQSRGENIRRNHEQFKPYSYSDRERELAEVALKALRWNEADPQDAIRKAGVAIAFKVHEYNGYTNNHGTIGAAIDYACFRLGITVPIGDIEERLNAPEGYSEGQIPVFNGLEGKVRFPNSYGTVVSHLQEIVGRQPKRNTR